MLIHGVSGSGKSSLVRAGVLPKLALQYRRHGAPWLTCEMRPSGGPLWNLAAEFARLEGRGGDLERISAIAGPVQRPFERRFASRRGRARRLGGKSVCLLVDQFEELFRYEKERAATKRNCSSISSSAPRPSDGTKPRADVVDLHASIVTMRSEFLGECARFAGFAETINRHAISRAAHGRRRPDARRARPAEMYGGEFGETLAERLIASVRGREDELPLLQTRPHADVGGRDPARAAGERADARRRASSTRPAASPSFCPATRTP